MAEGDRFIADIRSPVIPSPAPTAWTRDPPQFIVPGSVQSSPWFRILEKCDSENINKPGLSVKTKLDDAHCTQVHRV